MTLPANLRDMPGQPGPGTADDRLTYSQLVRDLATVLQLRSFDPVEMSTRRQLPGVNLLPVPSWSYRAVAPGANTVLEIDLPDALSIIGFSALETVEFYASFNGGRIIMPAVASNASGTLLAMDGFRPPPGAMFYCRNARRVSLGIAAANAVVTIFGVQQVG